MLRPMSARSLTQRSSASWQQPVILRVRRTPKDLSVNTFPTASVVTKPMKAVLLDRDGVINALVYHHDAGVIDAPFTRPQFQLLPRVPEAIRLFNDLGLHVAIVSNQPGIAKGHLKRETFKYFERSILSAVRKVGGRIDHIYYCLHHPDAKVTKLRQKCDCRKPGVAMLQQAA